MKIKVDFNSNLKIPHKDIANFYKENWINNSILRDKKFYNWEYKTYGDNKFLDRIIIAINSKNKNILGIYSFQTQKLFFKNISFKISCGSTFNVGKNSRGFGVAKKILRFAKKKSDIIYAINITKPVVPLYKKQNFRIIKAFPRYLKKANNIKQKIKKSYFIKKLTIKDKKLINSVKEKKLKNSIFIERDSNYFNWRYFKHPYLKYEVYYISSDKKLNDGIIVVLRTEKKYNFLRIIDFFGSEKSYQNGLDFIYSHTKKNNINNIDFFSLNKKLNCFFKKKKWNLISSNQKIKLPYLYQPLLYRGVNSPPFAIWMNSKSLDLFKAEKIHFTKCEGDFDRPTFYSIKNK